MKYYIYSKQYILTFLLGKGIFKGKKEQHSILKMLLKKTQYCAAICHPLTGKTGQVGLVIGKDLTISSPCPSLPNSSEVTQKAASFQIQQDCTTGKKYLK